MRSCATRVVLAALTVVIGVVLALPMLLSRKAEAGAAFPLAADADGLATGWARGGSRETERRDGGDDGLDGDVTSLLDYEPSPDGDLACARAHSEEGAPGGSPDAKADTGSVGGAFDVAYGPEALRRSGPAEIDPEAAALAVGLLPEPLILPFRRLYHLRP